LHVRAIAAESGKELLSERSARGNAQHIRHDSKFAESGIKFYDDDSDSISSARNCASGISNLQEQA